MIRKIKEIISPDTEAEDTDKKIILVDTGGSGPQEPDMRVVGVLPLPTTQSSSLGNPG